MASASSDTGGGGLVSFHQLAVATTALTFVLLLLGIYTAVAGAGLTCAGRWPFCDGWLGLFPANWPSFIEWFHRLVAMVVGFMVFGLTVSAWRRGRSKAVRWATTGALALLPTQIILGALTVTQYEIVILTAHFVFAVLIFSLLVTATALTFDTALETPQRWGALAAFALVPVVAVATPFVLISGSVPVHIGYYAVGLLAFAALLSLGLWSMDESASRRTPATAFGAAALLAGLLLQGRLVIAPSAQAELALAGGLIGGLALAAAWWALRDAAGGLVPALSRSS
ncbi:cytochrome c oxidase assembly protein subunit 15 [Natronoarchaeum philippinense]|uniref:Cytochrome c oxidase assembly protein subunit 15 n=1 Tax=Natronoarchaeum philippinense TaxID=558529 RepID=A0A285N819_NATPI|nr:COX15/CtaA family protein [Natronoarchaeum philippinense]SNZ05560.1 cytochrome c oxidase assembly protein subunit 15 [Natronoarchaeum philippinense]